MVGPQEYIEDGASADDIKIFCSDYVHRIINIRLLWRCHRHIWPIYMCSRLGGTLLANLAPPIQPKLTYIWYAWNRILFPPPRALIWIPTSLQPIKQLPVIGHIIYMIYVQHSWIGICQWYDQYRWKWGIYYWFGVYITINYIAIMMGESIDSTILEWKIIWEVYHGNVYLRKYIFK